MIQCPIDRGGVTILGNLSVQGTQTQLDTTTLNVQDKNIINGVIIQILS